VEVKGMAFLQKPWSNKRKREEAVIKDRKYKWPLGAICV
jgi:hypothetical protein